MSKGLGLGVMAIGVAALGWWAQGNHAHRIETGIAGAAAQAVAGSVHGVRTEVSGRDIHLGGTADGQAEADRLLAALDAVAGRRVVTSDLTVLETVSPFTIEVTKPEGGALTARGHVPTEAFRTDIGGALGEAASGLVLAAGAPEGWADLARAGLAALGPMTEGAMMLSDGALSLSGTVRGPDEAAAVDAALAALPQGQMTRDITLLDDGTPADFTVDYSAADGAVLAGKLPPGIDAAAIAAALGLPGLSGKARQGIVGATGDLSPLAAIRGWMGRIETLRLAMGPGGNRAEIGLPADLDAEAAQAELAAGMAGFEVAAATATVEGSNGQTRTNAATGESQRLMGGYWLTVPQIEVGLQGCQAAADKVLAGATINFLSGSDQLDAGAVKVINDLSAIMARCAEEAGLKAVIGGHTDSVGDPTANLGLSQRRATAVRREMVARGVPGAALKAVGYGAEVPIADNDSEEGRARNRRTTIVWSE